MILTFSTINHQGALSGNEVSLLTHLVYRFYRVEGRHFLFFFVNPRTDGTDSYQLPEDEWIRIRKEWVLWMEANSSLAVESLSGWQSVLRVPR